jgi:hypothetical protein
MTDHPTFEEPTGGSIVREGTCPLFRSHRASSRLAIRPGYKSPGWVGATRAGALLAALLAIAGSAQALQIDLLYDETIPGAVNPCVSEIVDGVEVPLYQACRGPGNTFVDRTPDLTATMEAVAEHWEHIIRDNHSVLIRYAWLDPALGAPDALILQRDGDGRPTESRIRISVNLGFFYDQNPSTDDGFDMRPRLYRTTHPAEHAEAFREALGEPLEVLEVGYHGFGPGNDLWSIVAHEMGHALGLAGVTAPICDPVLDPYFDVPGNLIGGHSLGIKGYEFNVTDDDGVVTGTQVDCNHLALGGINACKPPGQENVPVTQIFNDPSTMPGFTVGECASHQALMWQGQFPLARSKPSIVDILAVRQAGNWEDIRLPRNYALGSGNWHDDANWIGNRAPDAETDAYIVNQLPMFFVTEIGVTANAESASVFVSDENRLRLTNATLKIWDTLVAAGPATTRGPLRPPPPPPAGDDLGDDLVAPGPVTTVHVAAGGNLEAFDMVVEPGARLLLDAASAKANIGELFNAGTISGRGEIRIGAELQNTRLIFASGGTLKFFTPPADEVIAVPVLDLDGPGAFGSSLAAIRAIEGDLVFDGIIANPVRAGITVGPGRSIALPTGWTQGFSGLAAHRLLLDGGATGATIAGSSTLFGRTLVNGLGRFDGNLTVGSGAALHLGIGGLVPITDHDQVVVTQQAALGGNLMLAFTGGFEPAFTNTFTLMTFAGRSGEFDVVEIANLDALLEGGISFTVNYGPTEVVLAVGLQGGEPGSPNCSGQTTSTQTAIHGNISQAASHHGFPSVKAFMDALKEFCAG